MNENGFIRRMRVDKKSQPTIKRNIEFTKVFKKYLLENKKRKIEAATLQDLEDFRTWGETGFKGIPPTPKEAEHTVALARYLKKYVEY